MQEEMLHGGGGLSPKGARGLGQARQKVAGALHCGNVMLRYG